MDRAVEADVFRQPPYMAASEEQAVAATFAEDGSPIIEYRVPAGCRRVAEIPEELSAYPEEKEWLIRAYTGMRYFGQEERMFPSLDVPCDEQLRKRRLVVTFELVDEAEVPADAPSHLMVCDAPADGSLLTFRGGSVAGIMIDGRCPGDAVSGKALIVGIRDYDRDALKNTVHDAEDLAAKLTSIGFEVTLLTDDNGADLSYKGLNKTIRKFVKEVDANTAVVFAFMGHGAELAGEHYLLPQEMVDDPEDLPTEAIHQQKTLADIEAKKPIVTLAILDCCREKVMGTRSGFGGPGGLAALAGPAGSLVMYAVGEGQLAQDGNGRNGVFTEVLLQYIDQPMELNKIAMAVRRDVEAKTGGKQLPEHIAKLNHVVQLVTASDEAAASPRDDGALVRTSTYDHLVRTSTSADELRARATTN